MQLALVPNVPFAYDGRDHDAGGALKLNGRVRLAPGALRLQTAVAAAGGRTECQRASERRGGEEEGAYLLHLEAELVGLLPRAGHMVLCRTLGALDNRAVFAIA